MEALAARIAALAAPRAGRVLVG
ncbi:MAG: hypothetical protein RLZZ413_3696, partial [Pseudomonadota bacterium]